jgi:glycosyltransferase involved in cell wall biosynthesis
MNNLVSVIIPSYNHSSYIKECVESVLNQTHENFELLILDDGSGDNSMEILKELKDDRIRLFQHENIGAAFTINKGLSLCKGEFITILNSDDTYDPKRLEIALDHFKNDKSLAFISTWMNIINTSSKVTTVKKAWKNLHPWPIPDTDNSYINTNDYALNALIANFVGTTSNMIFRRRVYEEIGGMKNLRFTHDWDFLLRVCSRFECKNIERPLVSYRIHDDNTIHKDRADMLFEIFWIWATHIDRFQNRIIGGLSQHELWISFLKLFESMNFQGNDKFFWTLYYQIKTLREIGLGSPEDIYLENPELKKNLVSKILI